MKLQHVTSYLILATFCLNLFLPKLPLASAEDRNASDSNLIALADNQNPNFVSTDSEENLTDEDISVEAPCTPGVDCPEDLVIKMPNVQNGYQNEAIDPFIPQGVKEVRTVIVTAYSSTPDQTDDSPFITANGTFVRDGIVACNFLPFGAKVRFPDFSGDKIYTVTDRMALKNSHKVDIWMESRSLALQFGVNKTYKFNKFGFTG